MYLQIVNFIKILAHISPTTLIFNLRNYFASKAQFLRDFLFENTTFTISLRGVQQGDRIQLYSIWLTLVS